MEDFIAAYPKIDCVFGQNDSEGLGAYHAIKDAGLKMVPIAGLDAPPEVMRLISEGEYFGSVGYTPGWEAAFSMARVYDAAHGFKFHPLERMMHFQGPILTGKNVKEYMDWVYGDQKDRSGPPMKLPFDWKKMSRVLHPNDWDPQNWVYPMDVATIWAYAIDKKPAGYTLPKAYTDSLTNGDLEKIKKMYADHYKGNFTKQFKPSFFDHEKGF
jgi:ribose transport system substrate-binding protein